MVYTLTVNPSIDYIVSVQNFSTGKVNRSTSEKVLAGGKGINVSTVLNNLGVENVALGFVAGFTGEKIESLLNEKAVRTDFIHLENGMSRINVKLQSDVETEINARGPAVDKKSVENLFEKLNLLSDGDFLVMAGNIPSSLPHFFYAEIMEKLSSKKINFVVDATGKLLTETLKWKPFLIKPNNYELSEIFDAKITDRKSVVPYAKKLQEMGAQNVLVSLAENGAVLCSSDGQVFESDAPKGVAVNSVGAGDSMVAGFLADWIEYKNFESALKNGILSGSASTFSGELATKDSINKILSEWK